MPDRHNAAAAPSTRDTVDLTNVDNIESLLELVYLGVYKQPRPQSVGYEPIPDVSALTTDMWKHPKTMDGREWNWKQVFQHAKIEFIEPRNGKLIFKRNRVSTHPAMIKIGFYESKGDVVRDTAGANVDMRMTFILNELVALGELRWLSLSIAAFDIDMDDLRQFPKIYDVVSTNKIRHNRTRLYVQVMEHYYRQTSLVYWLQTGKIDDREWISLLFRLLLILAKLQEHYPYFRHNRYNPESMEVYVVEKGRVDHVELGDTYFEIEDPGFEVRLSDFSHSCISGLVHNEDIDAAMSRVDPLHDQRTLSRWLLQHLTLHGAVSTFLKEVGSTTKTPRELLLTSRFFDVIRHSKNKSYTEYTRIEIMNSESSLTEPDSVVPIPSPIASSTPAHKSQRASSAIKTQSRGVPTQRSHATEPVHSGERPAFNPRRVVIHASSSKAPSRRKTKRETAKRYADTIDTASTDQDQIFSHQDYRSDDSYRTSSPSSSDSDDGMLHRQSSSHGRGKKMMTAASSASANNRTQRSPSGDRSRASRHKSSDVRNVDDSDHRHVNYSRDTHIADTTTEDGDNDDDESYYRRQRKIQHQIKHLQRLVNTRDDHHRTQSRSEKKKTAHIDQLSEQHPSRKMAIARALNLESFDEPTRADNAGPRRLGPIAPPGAEVTHSEIVEMGQVSNNQDTAGAQPYLSQTMGGGYPSAPSMMGSGMPMQYPAAYPDAGSNMMMQQHAAMYQQPQSSGMMMMPGQHPYAAPQPYPGQLMQTGGGVAPGAPPMMHQPYPYAQGAPPFFFSPITNQHRVS